MTLSAERLAALDAFIIDLNRASAEVILPLFRADHGLEDKGAGKNLPRDS
ncbi:MAG: histidinol-phosphatase, partial [Caulobacter sp. 35-67-4]